MNPLLKLNDFGQSYWLDNLTRDMIESGELKRRVENEGLGGITSNPSTFNKAIRNGTGYEARIKAFGRDMTDADVYEALVTDDVRDACDILRPVFDRTDGVDGFVSLEVSPHLARDTAGSIEEGRRLWRKVCRPNLMIKIPGTAEGLDAIEELLFEGINVNVTLLFSLAAYQAVASRYVRALERRTRDGRPLSDVASVASFFLSRIDVAIDEILRERAEDATDAGTRTDLEALAGRTAVSCAKIAYQWFRKNLSAEPWLDFAAQGARPQRLLWASTSTKNPDYDDLMYVEPLIGRDTVNTLPEGTIDAFRDHGTAASTVESGLELAVTVTSELSRYGIDAEKIMARLENEGIEKFVQPFDELMKTIVEARA